jgi:hypothetical protein
MREAGEAVLELLINHELAIKHLYETFSTAFTERESLWQNLASEEQGHADSLGTLRSEANIESWLLHNSPIRLQAIKSSIGYVESQITRTREGKFTLMQALSIARDLENALLERQFSKLSDSAPPKIRAVLLDLAVETEKHQKAIIDAITDEKRSG